MYNRRVYHKLQLIINLFLLSFLVSCNTDLTEHSTNVGDSNSLQKSSRLLIPDTYVQGFVYLGGSPQSGATVYLLDEYNNVLTQTTSAPIDTVNYRMAICNYGYGERTVKAVYIDKWDNTYMDIESFTFSEETGYANDWLFEIDLYLQEYK